MNDEVHFRRGHGNNAVTGIFGSCIMEELHNLLIEYDIIGWWSDPYGRQEERPPNPERADVNIRFDNDSGFFAIRWVSRREGQRDDVNALLRFFEELERQAIQAMPVEPDPTTVILTITKMPLEYMYEYLKYLYEYTDSPPSSAVVTTHEVSVGDVINLDFFSTITIREITNEMVNMRFESDSGMILTFGESFHSSTRNLHLRYGNTFRFFGFPMDEVPMDQLYEILEFLEILEEILENIDESDLYLWEIVFLRE